MRLWFLIAVSSVGLAAVVGCYDVRKSDSAKSGGEKPKARDSVKSEPDQGSALPELDPRTGRVVNGGANSVDVDGDQVHDETWAVDRVVAEIAAAAADRPTLAVWLIDASASATPLREQIASRLSWAYPQATKRIAAEVSADEEPRLLSAGLAFGKEVTPLLKEPAKEPDDLISAIRAVPEDKTGTEMVFTAVEQALDKYLDADDPKRRQVLLIIATNEAGNDDEKLDSLLPMLRKQAVPVYVIGAPAPFGREAGIPQLVEASLDATGAAQGSNVRQGPESREWERVDLASSALISDGDLADSGFGPFALSWLAKDSGGSFLAVRGAQGELFGSIESEATKIDYKTMERYRPDYVSAKQYQEMLASNGAMMALHRASQLPRTDILNVARYEFQKREEAQLARDLSEAQTAAARVEQPINTMHQALAQGEKDRPNVTSPRWQAGYDLAMGRVLAAKARTEGYNVMLANLKQGRSFKNPESKTWVLQPAAAVEGNSALERMAKQAREYLERVANEHAGTPWAVVAQRELEIQVGWQWTEK